MAISNVYNLHTMTAGENMDDRTPGTGHIHKAVDRKTKKISATGETAAGLLRYTGLSGENVSYGDFGEMKFTAGSAINSGGVNLTVSTSGYMTEAGSGDWVCGYFKQGTNGSESVSSGGVGTGIFNFVTPHQLLS